MDNDCFWDNNPAEDNFTGFICVFDFGLGNFRRIQLPESVGADDQRIIGWSLGNGRGHADIGQTELSG